MGTMMNWMAESAKILIGMVLGAAAIMTWARMQEYDMGHLKLRVLKVETVQDVQSAGIAEVKKDTAVIRAILEERKGR